jgi:hypothetical protein
MGGALGSLLYGLKRMLSDAQFFHAAVQVFEKLLVTLI